MLMYIVHHNPASLAARSINTNMYSVGLYQQLEST